MINDRVNFTGPLVMVPTFVVDSMEQLMNKYNKIVKSKGEGLIVRKPGSYYEKKRSRNLLKIKFTDDEEATIVELLPGYSGHKYENSKAGRLKCLTNDGIEFFVSTGLTDDQRNNPSRNGIRVGALVTYKSLGKRKAGDVPREPVFKGLREDLGAL